jgi:hypothetical protein
MTYLRAVTSVCRLRSSQHFQTSRCVSAFASGTVSTAEKHYQELCDLSYWQNDLLTGLEMEPLPSLQVDAVPIVHHPLYSAPNLQQGHRFPMKIFQAIHDSLLHDGVVRREQVNRGFLTLHAVSCCIFMRFTVRKRRLFNTLSSHEMDVFTRFP